MHCQTIHRINKMYFSWVFTVVLAIIFMMNVKCASGATMSSQRNQTILYICPKDFIRIGASCYHFSKTQASWEEAYYYCKDRKSNFTAPERWEDRNIREYLNQKGIEGGERWIGGIFDWEAGKWKWGGALKPMNYQSFSRMPPLSREKLEWNCVAMIPELLYRWSPRLCTEKKLFICQSVLIKTQGRRAGNWRRRNPANQVKAELGNEVSPNNVYPDQMNNNIADVRTIGRAAFAHSNMNKNDTYNLNKKRKKLFPGYIKIKGDPEATYLHNVKALKSGKIKLSPGQIEKHLHRLERLRKKEEREKRLNEKRRNQRNKLRNRFGEQVPDSKLSSDRSNIRSRHIIAGKDTPANHENQLEFKRLLSFENVTQRTYTMNNQLSMLHPNTIVEIHEIVNKKQ